MDKVNNYLNKSIVNESINNYNIIKNKLNELNNIKISSNKISTISEYIITNEKCLINIISIIRKSFYLIVKNSNLSANEFDSLSLTEKINYIDDLKQRSNIIRNLLTNKPYLESYLESSRHGFNIVKTNYKNKIDDLITQTIDIDLKNIENKLSINNKYLEDIYNNININKLNEYKFENLDMSTTLNKEFNNLINNDISKLKNNIKIDINNRNNLYTKITALNYFKNANELINIGNIVNSNIIKENINDLSKFYNNMYNILDNSITESTRLYNYNYYLNEIINDESKAYDTKFQRLINYILFYKKILNDNSLLKLKFNKLKVIDNEDFNDIPQM